MTVAEIKKMLQDNNFNASDRLYWENKLKEAERKEMSFANNEIIRKEYEKGWK